MTDDPVLYSLMIATSKDKFVNINTKLKNMLQRLKSEYNKHINITVSYR